MALAKKCLLWFFVVFTPLALAQEAIDINTATAEQLETLPGIGPKKAQAIIDYREKHGPFQSVDDLTKVPGIGQKILEKIRDKITVGQPKGP
ncbi:MAG: ComEA family DNA-binding protein [Gammaproteobacteria bacterium]|nr:MAG: ComEA family DNA-binding protein [Gammaproteobacteria bacterium]